MHASALSRLRGGLRIGADFFERRRAVVAGARAPRGVVDRMEDLGNASLDARRVHPDVARFFVDTSGLELHVESAWRFPFSVAWPLVRWLMRCIGQFVLPVHRARIATRAVALDAALDGRADVRGIVRTYVDTGEVMQAVAYATWTRGATRYMSAAFPMPGGHVAGLLRLEAIGEDAEGRLAVALTSSRRGDDGDAGVYFVVGPFAVRSPLEERLELWPAETDGMDGAPSVPAPPGIPPATIRGRHEQRLFGVRFVTHHYWFWPTNGA